MQTCPGGALSAPLLSRCRPRIHWNAADTARMSSAGEFLTSRVASPSSDDGAGSALSSRSLLGALLCRSSTPSAPGASACPSRRLRFFVGDLLVSFRLHGLDLSSSRPETIAPPCVLTGRFSWCCPRRSRVRVLRVVHGRLPSPPAFTRTIRAFSSSDFALVGDGLLRLLRLLGLLCPPCGRGRSWRGDAPAPSPAALSGARG